MAAAIDVRAARVPIAVAARDDEFEPGCIELTDAAAVTLVVRNEGRHPHNLVTEDGRVAVDAGQVAILDADVGETGLRFVCTLHAGMEGEIRVRR